MSIGSKMRSLGDSTYFLKATYEPLKELMGDKDYIFIKDPINGYVIHTDRIDGELLENVDNLLNDGFGSKFRKTHYSHNMEISWRDINKYAKCKSKDDMLAVNPDYKNDLTSDGTWVYPITELKDATSLFANATRMKHFNIDISHLTNITLMFHKTGLTGHVILNHPTITAATSVFAGDNNWGFYTKVTLNLPNATNIHGICYHTIDLKEIHGNLDKVTNGNQAFFGRYGAELNSPQEFYVPLPSLSSGDYMFNRCRLTKRSVLLVCESIPTWANGTHPLMLGIHKDYKSDEEVLTAIANAENKGWTLTVQWNGRAGETGVKDGTSSTLGLRDMTIYAKVSNIELPDKTSKNILDWGHYVSNPEDYEEFSSLEEAYEHFGLSNDLEKLNNSEQ